MECAIKIEGLGKRYKIGKNKSGDLRETIVNLFKNKSTVNDTSFWALKDISFEVTQGEAIGIIGRNGAGKSTLLKILSRITKPTTGRFEINGRVSSLLEVGTGFHMELSGRENIFLNGTILGMKRREIKEKFDEIVAFSGVENFIDTPVKHYSSGMKVRLAFSVAAHLEPEILIIDEVLAVGDAEFQKKCLGKMEDVTDRGRTVLFVSHNMGAVSSLCSTAVFLENSQMKLLGSTNEVINTYLSLNKNQHAEKIWDRLNLPSNNTSAFLAVKVIQDNKISHEVTPDKPIEIVFEFENHVDGAYLSPGIHIHNEMDLPILASANWKSATTGNDSYSNQPLKKGKYSSKCIIPENLLNEGYYSVSILLMKNVSQVNLIEKNVVSFIVINNGALRKEYLGKWIGVIRPKLNWETKNLK